MNQDPVFDPEHNALDIGDIAPTRLAEVLTAVLERRYLDDFDPARFRLAQDHEDGVPILREVETVALQAASGVVGRAAKQLLAACHTPGHDLVIAVFGDGDRHRLYYGLRRRIGMGASDSAMAGLTGAFRAEFPGLSLKEARPLRASGHGALAAFLSEAPALASLTGIPSPAGAGLPRQQVDRLIAAMGRQRYACMIVAEALPMQAVEEAMAACRALVSELHPSIAGSVARADGATHALSTQRTVAAGGPSAQLPPLLMQSIAFAAGAGALAPLVGSLAGFASRPEGMAAVSSTSGESTTRSTVDTRSSSLLNAEARHCSQLVEAHHRRLGTARGGGWWRAAIYLAAQDETALHCASQALRGASVGEGDPGLEPIRMQRPPNHQLREAMQKGRLIRLRVEGSGSGNPLGAAQEALATCLNGEELAVLVAPPQVGAPGISIRERSEYAHNVPMPAGPAVALGRLVDGLNAATAPVALSQRAINEHVLVVGTPGSGKTNTCMRMLIEAHRCWGVPFLVIEPAKTEYRRLAEEPSLRGRLQVFSIGGDSGSQLRLNPLRPVPGASLMGHVDLLKAVFNASFAMYPGMPQVLEQALFEVYEHRGWNLLTSRNDALKGRHAVREAETLLPTLADLQRQVEVVLRERDYGEEVRRNMSAALTSRLNGLRLGAKGLVLDTRHSTPLSDLFDRPVVLELNNLRDDEEKSFVMAVVLALLNQYCEVRQSQYPRELREKLQHITLIEEAHRLLSASPRLGADSADARGKGVAIFTDMLAELRALGEGFIVAEQIPTKLAPDVLKNTNLKVVHRLTSPSDCAVIGESVNLTPPQLRALVGLPSGDAVVHGLPAAFGETVPDAVLVRVDSIKDALGTADSSVIHMQALPTASLWRLGGCESCRSACSFYPQVLNDIRRPIGETEFRDGCEALLTGNPVEADAGFEPWRRVLSRHRDFSEDELLCLFIHAAERWLHRVMSFRQPSRGAGLGVVPADLLLADRLTAAFGRLARERFDPPPDAGDAGRSLQDASIAALAPVGGQGSLDACRACPAPCTAAVYAATRADDPMIGSLVEAMPRGATDAFGRSPVVDNRMDRVVKVLDAMAGPALAQLAPDRRAALRYCQVAHLTLPASLNGYRAELLARLAAL